MHQPSTATIAAPTQVLFHQPQTPNVVHGYAVEDVQDGLDHFERVAELNSWSEERKLRDVYFALRDSAKTWLENHEATLISWDEVRRLLAVAHSNTGRKDRAELAIQARIHASNESVATYTEDLTRIFRRADA